MVWGLHLQQRLASLIHDEGSVGGAAALVTPQGSWCAAGGIEGSRTQARVSEHTRFRLASVTKSMTAATILHAAMRGELDLDAPPPTTGIRFVGPGARRGRVPTVRQLLSHTGGLGDLRSPGELVRTLTRTKLRHRLPVGKAQAEFPDGKVFLDVAPGTKFAYTNQGFTLLGRVAAEIMDTDFAGAVQQMLFEPAGMTDAVVGRRPKTRVAVPHVQREGTLVELTPKGSPAWFGGRGAGSVWASPRDLAAFMAALLGINRSLPDGLGPLAWTPYWHTHPSMPGWGLGLATDCWEGVPVAFHNGYVPGSRALMLLLPQHQVGVAILLNSATGLESMDSRKSATAWAIAREAAGLPNSFPVEQPPAAPDPVLCGRYRWPAGLNTNLRSYSSLGTHLDVRTRDGQLVLVSPRGRFVNGAPLGPPDHNGTMRLTGQYFDSRVLCDGKRLILDQTSLHRSLV